MLCHAGWVAAAAPAATPAVPARHAACIIAWCCLCLLLSPYYSDITASMFTFASHDQLCTAQTDDTGSFVCTYTVDSAWYAENPDVFW